MARIILSNGENNDSVIGGSVINEVFGANGSEQIRIGIGGRAVLDASFNRGGDTINLLGTAASYNIRQSGSSIILTDDVGGTITIPVGTAGATIAFADASRTLVYNTTTNQIELGGQIVSTTDADVDPGNVGPGGDVFDLTPGVAAGATVARITGDQGVRFDVTRNDNQVTGLDLNGDGIIANDGVENVNPTNLDDTTRFGILDAYSRNKANEGDLAANFLGNIAYDGTGFGGDGVNTDGNIVLGGLGADTILGGIGNDFLTGGGVNQAARAFAAANGLPAPRDELFGGRNADFFFADLSLLDNAGGNGLFINGGNTTDDAAVGNNTAQDRDWLLIEVADDEDGTIIDLATNFFINAADETLGVTTGVGQAMTGTDIENVDASGNIYGFLNDFAGSDLVLGEGGGANSNGEYQGIGSSAQLEIRGSIANNILIGGYDNDLILGRTGSDLLFGGNLNYALFNPNATGIVNDGMDELFGGDDADSLVWEADGGVYEGENELDVVSFSNDTLWLTNQSLGSRTAAELTTDGVLRFDLGTGGGSGIAGGLNAYAGYGGADQNGRNGSYTADQTNYALGVSRTTTQDMESVITTGLGAIDFLAAGSNDPDLTFNNQQNFGAYNGDLDVRGTMGENTIYLAGGNDVIEGRQGNDFLSGGEGNDDFIFELGVSSGDGVDVIHRQRDDINNGSGAAGSDNLWDATPEGAAELAISEGLEAGTPEFTARVNELLFTQDFGRGGTSSTGPSRLTIDFVNANLDDTANPDPTQNNTFLTSFSVNIGGVTFAVTDPADLAELQAAQNASEVAAVANRVFNAIDSNVSVASDGTKVIITDATPAGGREISDVPSEGYAVVLSVVAPGTGTLSTPTYTAPGTDSTEDRLIYMSYEDRADGEKTNDSSINGSNVSLGVDNYAEDLVISFGEDGTRIAEDQEYVLTFTNLTTQDTVKVSVNGVDYTLTVGVDLDGNIIAGEDGVNDTQADIQTAFLSRLAGFINTFNDRNTAAGQLGAAATTTTLTITPSEYAGEETVFIKTPVVTITNTSGGEAADVTIVNTSQHEVHLVDFDGRNGELNAANVLFVGDTGINRATLQTAKDAGETITGTDAVLIDNGANTHAATVANTGDTVFDSQATNSPLDGVAQIYSVHGDDLLIGGSGNDTLLGGTGDDRIIGSRGTDTVDGGKDYYAVQVLGEPTARVYELNSWEAANPTSVAALSGLTISSITAIQQTEDGSTLAGAVFQDTLQFQQADFTANTRFTIALDTFDAVNAGIGGSIEFRDGGAGQVGIDIDGDGTLDAGQVTTFSNFENIRTVSGTGKADASGGQGRDTLDLSALSNADQVGGVAYNLSNDANGGLAAGQVRYSEDLVDVTPPTDQVGGQYEVAVINVDGVESVIGGEGADLLYIDETEANKDNAFVGSLGQDRIIYTNDYGSLAPEPTVTIKLDNIAAVTSATSGVDTVSFTGGRNGSTVATDSLTAVERVTLNGGTARGTAESDLLDITSLTAGGQVNYGNGEISSGGTVHLTVDGLNQIESVEGAAGVNDTVFVADSAVMGANTTSDGPADAENIRFLSYLDFDDLVAGTTDRKSFEQQVLDGEVELVLNQGQYTFDLSSTGSAADIDRVDYSAEEDNIIVSVGQETDVTPQYVIVDGNGNGDLDDVGDRVDILLGVEEVVASLGESVLDFTTANADRQVTFQYAAPAGNPAENQVLEQTIRIADGSGNTIDGLNAFVEKYTYNKATPAVADATWNRVEGGDQNEVIIYQGSEDLVNQAGLDHRYTDDILNLRGGSNEVRYSPLETSITAVINVTEEDDATTAAAEGLIQATVNFQDGVGGALAGGGTHTITSNTSDNSTAAGNLKIEGSQDAEDSVTFNSGSDKVYVLGTSPGVITVNVGDLQSIVLTGFEVLVDSSSDDVYDFAALSTLSGLTLTDTLGDSDTLLLRDGALQNTTVNGQAINFADDTIELDDVEAAFGGFDFAVLDISEITTETDVVSTLDLAGDTVILGDVSLFGDADATIDVQGFETVAFSTTDGMGTSVTIDMDTGQFRNSGGVLFTFDNATTFDFSALTTAMNVTVVDAGGAGVTVLGSTAGDTLSGADGDDTFTGGAGADVMDGGIVAEVTESVVVTLNGGANTLEAGDDLVIGGIVVSDAGGDVNVVAGSDSDQVGSAYATFANANLDTVALALGLAAGDLGSVDYDSDSNNIIFNFTSQAGDVPGGTVTVDDTGMGAGTLDGTVFEDGTDVEGQSVAYAAQADSADTFIYLLGSDSTSTATDQIDNFTVVNGAVRDVLDFTAIIGGGQGDVVIQDTDFADLAAVIAAADADFQAGNSEIFVGSDGTNAWVVVDTPENNGYQAGTDMLIQLNGLSGADLAGLTAANFLGDTSFTVI